MSRLGRPMSAQGKATRDKAAYHAQSRAAVSRRTRGFCEGCGAQAPLDWSHGFGRRHIISEPWCSSPELTFGLCRPCHRAVDGNVDAELRDRLRWVAVGRFAAKHDLGHVVARGMTPVDAVHAMERALEDRQ